MRTSSSNFHILGLLSFSYISCLIILYWNFISVQALSYCIGCSNHLWFIYILSIDLLRSTLNISNWLSLNICNWLSLNISNGSSLNFSLRIRLVSCCVGWFILRIIANHIIRCNSWFVFSHFNLSSLFICFKMNSIR